MNSKFQVNFGFEKDPDDGKGASTRDSASWGWFQIFIGETNLCKHFVGDRVFDRVHWYLLPLLEWFAENWDALFHECKLPEPFADAASARIGFLNYISVDENDEQEARIFEWSRRHSLRSAASGGIFPDIFFRRSRNEIEVSWGHTKTQGALDDLRFLAAAGSALLDPKETATCSYKAIRQALHELRRLAGDRVDLSALSSGVEKLSEPRVDSRAAMMMGIGTSAQEWNENLVIIRNKLGSEFSKLVMPPDEALVISRAPAAILMFGSLSPQVVESDVDILLDVLKDAADANIPATTLPKINHKNPSVNGWKQGYDWAADVSEQMDVPKKGCKVEVEKLLHSCMVRLTSKTFSDSKLRAVAVCGDGLRPLIVSNASCKINETKPGLRFTLAHELCHLLFDREIGVPLAVASGRWAPAHIEQRANAFAAMFLMPADSCRDLFVKFSTEGKSGRQVVAAIATEFGTGKMATLNHLVNLGLIDEDEKSSIAEDFTSKK